MRRALFLFVICAACGDYVRYHGDPPGGVDRGSLDEQTKEKLKTVDHLDHLLFDTIVSRYVDGGTFDYDALNGSNEAQLVLDQYLATLDVVTADQLKDGNERFAYWINAYNAAVIRGVLDAWGGSRMYSVQDGGGIFFDTPAYSFGGTRMSLNQLEHAILRGDEQHAAFARSTPDEQARFRQLHQSLWEGRPVDARVHVAINCASRSCPDLQPHAFRADTLETQLGDAARAFLDNEAKGAGGSGISQIFRFVPKDFEPVYGNAAGFIDRLRTRHLEGVNLDLFLTYDWSLNIKP